MAKPIRSNKMTPAFLRLLLAKMESPKTTTKEFVQLSKVYAGIIGGKTVKEASKKDKRLKAEKPVPAPILTETELIQQIEAAQRNSNG